jgi:ADP-ribosylglycohydrolase
VLGSSTDDTQLTVATCESILDSGEVSPEKIAATFVRWHRARRFTGLGASTWKALTELEAGQHWALSGARGERAAGNGAAMRVAPVAFCLDPRQETDRRTLRDVCRITHHHDEAYVGALAVTFALRALSRDEVAIDEMLMWIAQQLPDSQVRDQLQRLAAMESARPDELRVDIGTSGFVAHSVPLALAAATSNSDKSFEEIVSCVISLGGDCDTNASLTGQLIGAQLGKSNLPAGLLAALRLDDELLDVIEQFAGFCCKV